MPFESKMKLAAFKVAIDINLKGMNKNPERCARNLVELVSYSFSDLPKRLDTVTLYQSILSLIRENNDKKIKEMLLEIVN